jgi:dCMP deaminase
MAAMKIRPDKDHYYLNIAREVSRRSTCLRRCFGAVIVKNDQIISTGYAGAARGAVNCIDLGVCPRQAAGIPRGERYELCRSVHAEMNAIIHASRAEMLDSTLYLVGVDAADGSVVEDARPCRICTRLIINAGIRTVKVLDRGDEVRVYEVADLVTNEELDLGMASGY